LKIDREEDGRWIAEVPSLPGAMAYGATKDEAVAAAEALALRVIADKIEEQKEPAKKYRVIYAAAKHVIQKATAHLPGGCDVSAYAANEPPDRQSPTDKPRSRAIFGQDAPEHAGRQSWQHPS